MPKFLITFKQITVETCEMIIDAPTTHKLNHLINMSKTTPLNKLKKEKENQGSPLLTPFTLSLCT